MVLLKLPVIQDWQPDCDLVVILLVLRLGCECMQCPFSRHIHQALRIIYGKRKLGTSNIGKNAVVSVTQVL